MAPVTHGLGAAAEVADRAAVMHAGQIVEQGPGQDVLRRPAHPHTRGLLASVVRADGAETLGIPGRPPDLRCPPPECAFAARRFRRSGGGAGAGDVVCSGGGNGGGIRELFVVATGETSFVLRVEPRTCFDDLSQMINGERSPFSS